MGNIEDHLLSDIALVTGATMIDNDHVMLSDLDLSHFGTARKVVVKEQQTDIIDGAGSTEAISQRI